MAVSSEQGSCLGVLLSKGPIMRVLIKAQALPGKPEVCNCELLSSNGGLL